MAVTSVTEEVKENSLYHASKAPRGCIDLFFKKWTFVVDH